MRQEKVVYYRLHGASGAYPIISTRFSLGCSQAQDYHKYPSDLKGSNENLNEVLRIGSGLVEYRSGLVECNSLEV